MQQYLTFFSARMAGQYEIIVVVNGSVDRTPEVAAELASQHPNVRAIIEPKAIGKGGAIIRGFDVAEGEYVGFVDADGATPPEAFFEMYEKILSHAKAGAIIASRWLPGAKVSPQPRSRQIASRIFNYIVRFLFRLKITDTQCGAKILSHPAVVQVLPQIGLTRWAFDVDLLFKLRRAGYTILEIPTTWNDVAGSKVNVPKASLEMLLAICRLRIKYSEFYWIVDFYDATLGKMIHKGQ